MEDEDKKVECSECGDVHKWSERKMKIRGYFKCYYCPKCGEESYVEPKEVDKIL